MENQHMNRTFKTRVFLMLAGNILMGFASSLFRISDFGTDPFTCMNLGASSTFHMQFGTYQFLVNIIIFLFVLWKSKISIGLGTVVNMFGNGYISDFGVYLFTHNIATSDELPTFVRVILMILAVVLCSFAAAMYMEAAMGIAPYDAVAVIIENATHQRLSFKYARVITDVTCVIIGVSLGSVAGISTIITACFLGPLIQFFRNLIP